MAVGEGPVRTPGGPSEDAAQQALLSWAQHVTIMLPAPQGPTLLCDALYHVPNGGARHAAVGALMKSLGTKPGVPDLILDVACGGFHGARWELKVGRNTLSESQKARHQMLKAAGYYVATWWDWAACGNDMLRYLNRGPYSVVARAQATA